MLPRDGQLQGSTLFPTPPRDAHLRQTRFREVGENVERWVWEPPTTAWRLESTRTRAEVDAAIERHRAYAEAHPITRADLERGKQLARERGWI